MKLACLLALTAASATLPASEALKDGLDAQLFPCSGMSVRQRWTHNTQTGRVQLRWTGVDPALTQALVQVPAGGGSPPRIPVAGQLSTWGVENHHGGGGANASTCSNFGALKRTGCYNDNAVQRLLSDQQLSSDQMTIEACAAYCRDPSWPGGAYDWLAVEDKDQCFCGRSKPQPGKPPHDPHPCFAPDLPCDAGCTPPGGKQPCCCGGNHSETCGGVGFLELYDASAVTCEAGGGKTSPDKWTVQPTQQGGGDTTSSVKLVNQATGKCATANGCDWTTQTRNCHDGQCHDAAACPVTAGDCDSPGAEWSWNTTSGQFRSIVGDKSKPGLPLCLDAGTTYPNSACSFGINTDKPFCDPSLPTAERARDLISRMSLDEKLQQLLSEAPAIPHLGIGRYQYWGEALHGQIGPGTTVFPQVIGLAASFNRSAWVMVGATASTELRVGVNTAICLEGAAQRCSGLSVFAPNANSKFS